MRIIVQSLHVTSFRNAFPIAFYSILRSSSLPASKCLSQAHSIMLFNHQVSPIYCWRNEHFNMKTLLSSSIFIVVTFQNWSIPQWFQYLHHICCFIELPAVDNITRNFRYILLFPSLPQNYLFHTNRPHLC